MHSFEGKKTYFNFNSDMSGRIRIINKKDPDGTDPEEIWVDGEDLLDFVASYVSRRRLVELEQQLDKQTTEEVLGIKSR